MEEEKYAIADFIYWLEKYHDVDEKQWTHLEIARLVSEAMLNFLPDKDGF